MWALGAVMELDEREKLETFALAHPSKLDWPKCNENETIFEYVVNPENGRWEHWSNRVEPFIYPTDSELEFTSILVPNVDNVRTAFLIHTIAKQSKAVLLIGTVIFSYTYKCKIYLQIIFPFVYLTGRILYICRQIKVELIRLSVYKIKVYSIVYFYSVFRSR